MTEGRRITDLKSRAYEVMYILRSNLGAEVISAAVTRFRELTEGLGGTVDSVDEWGMRRMAYEIDDFAEGYYVVMQYSGDETLNRELDRRLGLDDSVLRFMIVKQED